MDYIALAEEFVDMRARVPQIRVEKDLSDMMRGEASALNYLSVRGGEAHPREISSALAITTARVASILKSLERQGMIMRTPDPNDSRQVIVRLTEAGNAVTKERRDQIIQSTAKMFEFLGEEDAVSFVRIQKRLLGSGMLWR